MNKKIIAIAVAAAVSAPAAMADVKVGGQIGAAYISASKGFLIPSSNAADKDGGEVDGTDAYRTMTDSGLSKLEFSGKDGNAFFKIGMDIRNIMGKGAGTGNGRDFNLGYKFGSTAVKFGRMPSALAGLEKDKYNATFLESRRTAAVATTNNDTTDTYNTNPIIEVTTKAGAVAIKAQYDAGDKTDATSGEGYYAIAVSGKAGPVGYFAGINNGLGSDAAGTDDSNMKLGASMKFGAVKATLMLMSSDTATANSDKESTANMADMGLGNGLSVGVGYGVQTGTVNKDDTWMRLALTKSLSKKTSLFGGYVTKHDESAATNKDTNALGVGMKIKF